MNVDVFGLNNNQEEVRAEHLWKDHKSFLDDVITENDVSDVYSFVKHKNGENRIHFKLQKKLLMKICKRNKRIYRYHTISHNNKHEKIKFLRGFCFMPVKKNTRTV